MKYFRGFLVKKSEDSFQMLYFNAYLYKLYEKIYIIFLMDICLLKTLFIIFESK